MADMQPGSEIIRKTHHEDMSKQPLPPVSETLDPSVRCMDSGDFKGPVQPQAAECGDAALGGSITSKGSVLEATEPAPPAAAAEEGEQTIPFTCHVCGLSERCQYRGARPPFSGSVRLTERCYVLRDPFSARAAGAGQLPVLLGADCALCARAVCQDAGCSVFFTRHFCLPCARQRADQFPLQLRDKLGA